MIEPRYQSDRVTLYCGDCLDVLPQLQAVDAVITDPPYSDRTKNGARTRNDDKYSGDEYITFSIGIDALMKSFDLCGELCRRWFIASIDWYYGHSLMDNPPTGTKFVRAGAWIKPNSAPQFTGDRPSMGWEFIAILHGVNNPMRWNRGGARAVWSCAVERDNGHPTPKPSRLIRQWIEDFTDGGELILDPYMGSGTTGVAAMQTGRKFIGIEIDEKYYAIAEKRIRAAESQLLLGI